MKWQNDVASKSTEIQRLKGKAESSFSHQGAPQDISKLCLKKNVFDPTQNIMFVAVQSSLKS